MSDNPIEHYIKEFAVTEADLQLLREKLQSVHNPERELYQFWLRDEILEEWLGHIQTVYQTLKNT